MSDMNVSYLTFDELKRLVKATEYGEGRSSKLLAKKNPELVKRHKLMILVAFWHCLRVSEVINMTGSNIKGGYVRVKRLKKSRECNQPYVDVGGNPELAELDESQMLRELAKTIKPSERLFPITRIGFYNLMQRAGARAELPPHKRHPHCLKHSGVMAALPDGIQYARERAGHRSLASTGFYVQLTQDRANRAFALTALKVKTALEE